MANWNKKSPGPHQKVSLSPDLPPILRPLKDTLMLSHSKLPPDIKSKFRVQYLPRWPFVELKIEGQAPKQHEETFMTITKMSLVLTMSWRSQRTLNPGTILLIYGDIAEVYIYTYLIILWHYVKIRKYGQIWKNWIFNDKQLASFTWLGLYIRLCLLTWNKFFEIVDICEITWVKYKQYINGLVR